MPANQAGRIKPSSKILSMVPKSIINSATIHFFKNTYSPLSHRLLMCKNVQLYQGIRLITMGLLFVMG